MTLILLIAFPVCWAHAQGPAVKGLSLTTRDRMEDAGWWPTRGDALRSQYVGAETCKGCHSEISKAQEMTPMYHAGSRAEGSEILKRFQNPAFVEPEFSYSLAYTPQAITFSASDKVNSSTSPVTWAFGAGEYGQTYILQKEGTYTEARLSYFTSLNALNITPGQSDKTPQSAQEALGKRLDRETARQCFGCHTTAAVTSRTLESEKATPGVTCEACHGPGAAHVAAMKKNDEQDPTYIMNPAHLASSDSVDFCGACHRTWADVEMEMPSNMGNARVRFQPYRLEMSRCWDKGGAARITCLTCHDPHDPLVHQLGAYDAKCLACHAGRAEAKGGVAVKTCKVAGSSCVSCHMPKVSVPETHAVFTDHYIRVVRPT